MSNYYCSTIELRYGYIWHRAGNGRTRLPLSELGIQQLQQLAAAAACGAALLTSHSPPAAAASTSAPATPSSSEQLDSDRNVQHATAAPAAGLGVQAEPPSAIVLHNHCPMALLVGQVGTQECLELQSGASMPYTWLSAPGIDPFAQRLLHIAAPRALLGVALPAASASGDQDPEAGSGGSTSRQRSESMHASSSEPVGSHSTAWSKPVEAMARSASIVSVRLSGGLCTFMAVYATQVSGTSEASSARRSS